MSLTFNGVDIVFLDKVHATVLQALLPVAGEGEISRDRRLHALFNDLTCHIDPEVRHHFKNEVPASQRYYLLMSHYYLEHPVKAEQVLSSALHLRSSLHMPLIFVLLFHEYLFIKCANSPENSIKRMATFIKGANKLFWLDLENSSKRFMYIWMFLLKNVLQNPDRWQCLLVRRYLDVFDLVSKFYFYYNGEKDLEGFITSMQNMFSLHPVETPLGHQKLSPINMFCNEVVRTMKLMKEEAVLKHYLHCCRCFAQAELLVTGKKTLLRLGDLLSDLATPGYPLYPTSEVKDEAKRTLNIIWPYGAFLRETIRFSFRLLRPLSFLHWFQYRGAQLQSLLANIWLWLVGTIVLLLSSIPFLSTFLLGRGKQVKQDAIAAAQRSQELVNHLSERVKNNRDTPRRVRFKLPSDNIETSPSLDDTSIHPLPTSPDPMGDAPTITPESPPSDGEEDDIAVIKPPSNRARSPIRSLRTRNRTQLPESATLDEESIDSEPSSSSTATPYSDHFWDHDSAEETEDDDKDDTIDYKDLEHYLQYTADLKQAGFVAPVD